MHLRHVTLHCFKKGNSAKDRRDFYVVEKRPELANRRGVVFHRDNARPHVALAVRQKLLQFDPPYSPDLAPSDYYLFLSLKNSLRGKSFKSMSEIKTHLDEYFTRVNLNNFGKRA
ncbi:Histone-lysine N-methyltransferase SETMAR [Melipona quadrifasciata]|uniref:Histone-lysine N-methyltransferase SETMAR n=1 Tax=Melipona quadrifasciata TaxID=166423 RepID=A0A0N0U2X3_9HYME|nr:Histone-lysine N-methyltransferase SETMAR [Melipona quadrifasciata]